ncbi:MAG: hypothetical protein H0V45_14215 [Actinobacteria bacterium]|nr:hypothetical protein [Actinomycetota bacterium]
MVVGDVVVVVVVGGRGGGRDGGGGGGDTVEPVAGAAAVDFCVAAVVRLGSEASAGSVVRRVINRPIRGRDRSSTTTARCELAAGRVVSESPSALPAR